MSYSKPIVSLQRVRADVQAYDSLESQSAVILNSYFTAGRRPEIVMYVERYLSFTTVQDVSPCMR